MITTFLRSSSLGTLAMCQQQYFISYVLGWKSPANLAAEKGSIVHKVMELLAIKQLAKQNGTLDTEFEDDLLGTIKPSDIEVDSTFEVCFDKYVAQSELKDWGPLDRKHCKRWLHKILTCENGYFDPSNQDIVQPEKHFNITLPQEWASYKFNYMGETIEGQLGLKGTIDLIQRLDEDTLEIVDYKTGKRKNWATGEEKDFNKLMKDDQLRLYHYAACQLFPDAKHILMTILFINDGGSFRLPYDRADLPATEKWLKEKFEYIKSIQEPHLNIDWRCDKFCYFSKVKTKDGSSLCQKIHRDVLMDGMEKTVHNRTRQGFSLHSYGDGGGRKNI